MARTNS